MNKNHLVSRLLLFFIAGLSVFFSCNSDSDKIRRPIDPWALRSVLDHQPRMITLALDSECYVAYDLQNCALYKAWKGGVNWDGIVYNKIKIAQPVSWGTEYLLDKTLNNSWTIERNGQVELPVLSMQGYRFEHNQIYFTYRLSTPSDTVFVEERPEFVRDETGEPGLERIFRAKGLKSGVIVSLSSGDENIEIHGSEPTIFRHHFEPLPEQVQTTAIDPTEHKGKYWIERSDCFTCHDWTNKMMGPSFQDVAAKYSSTESDLDYLINKVKTGGTGVWGQAVMNPHPQLSESDLKQMVSYILSLDHEANTENVKIAKETGKSKKINEKPQLKPGFGASLEDVHPSFDLSTIHPYGTEFKVGGLAFLPDGRLIVAAWTAHGSVYVLDGITTGDSSRVTVKLIAQGLAEPLGLDVVDGEIFVLQKQELTQLIDHDGDEIIDEYKAICNGFSVSEDFHEFAFGLVFKDDHFYVNLSMPMRLMSGEKPLPDRGRTIKIARDGSFEWVNSGLREPNGIGIGVDDEIFITDNQGQWLPANKLIHLRPGDYHGMAWGLPDSLSDTEMVPPVVWLPEDELANSPSEPVLLTEGPYKDQIIFGDVSHGGINRTFIEKIDGAYQGVAFRFSQGFEAGINRIRRGPDGALYVGGVGMLGGWSWKEKTHGLQRLKYTGRETFEMLAIRAKPEGFEIEFTQPLAPEMGQSATDYEIEQWWYQPTPSYGGPKLDLTHMTIEEVRVSPDRKKVYLMIPGLQEGHVVYFSLNDKLMSSNGQLLWSGDAWYTLNNIPNL